MSDLEADEQRGRRNFHIALAGVFGVCLAPFVSWWAVFQQPSSDSTGWRKRLLALAVLDTLLVVCAMVVSSRLGQLPTGGRIGVSLDPTWSAGGAAIDGVATGSPAETAGLRVGDRIVTIDGEDVTSNEAVTQRIGTTPAGKTRMLHVRRGEEELDVSVEPTKKPARNAPKTSLFARAPGVPRWTLVHVLEECAGYFAALGVLAILAVVAARRKVKLRAVFVTMAAMTASMLALLGASLGLGWAIGRSLGSSLLGMLAGVVAMLVVAGLARERSTEASAVGTPLRTLPALGLGIFYALAGAARVSVFVAFASAVLHLPNHQASEVFGVSMSWGAGGVALFVLVTVFLGPLAEECLFRGVLLPWLARWTTPPIAVLLGSITFGIAHLFYGAGVLIPFVYGLALGWARMRTGRLRASILLHIFLNALATSVMLYTG